MKNKNLIFFSNDEQARFYAKVLAYNGCGGINKDINSVLADEFIKCSTVIWVSSVKNATINEFSSFTKHWDNLRYKNLIFVLVGAASAENSIYGQIWRASAAPTMQEKVHFFAVEDLRPKNTNSFVQNCLDLSLPFMRFFCADIDKSVNKISKCIDLLGG